MPLYFLAPYLVHSQQLNLKLGENMIIVTGGAGMIGSNIIKALNEQGINDILVVDNLKNGKKFKNLVDLDIADYMDRDDFLVQIMSGENFGPIDAVFHEGACSATTEWDGKYMMLNNYEYSKELLHYCLEREIPFLYASSAATYGETTVFKEKKNTKAPLMYTVTPNNNSTITFAKFGKMRPHTVKHCLKSRASAISMCTVLVKITKAQWRPLLST